MSSFYDEIGAYDSPDGYDGLIIIVYAPRVYVSFCTFPRVYAGFSSEYPDVTAGFPTDAPEILVGGD